jgi:hypothetical protein
MNDLLTALGVSPQVQALFNIGDLVFDYGDSFEQFECGFHKVPACQNLWRSGNEFASQVIITNSVMEAVAFAQLNLQKNPDLDALFFISIGNGFYPAKLNWIRKRLKKRKFTLVFGDDLLGRLQDIKVATALRNRKVTLHWSDPNITIKTGARNFKMNSDKISLASFEREAGIRTAVRTSKPLNRMTFLEQLKYQANW